MASKVCTVAARDWANCSALPEAPSDEITADAPGCGWNIALDMSDVTFVACTAMNVLVILHHDDRESPP